MTTPTFDAALYGLEDRTPGSPCDHGLHDEYYCRQITLGRDVSEYRPDIRLRHEADLRAARMLAGRSLLDAMLRRAEEGGDLFTGEPGRFRSRKPSWPLRLLALLRRLAVAATYHVGQVIFYGGRKGTVVHVGGGLVTVRFAGWMTMTFRAFQLG